MLAKFHVHDVGSVLEITVMTGNVSIDLSQATLLQLRLRKPDNSATILRTATKLTDGKDGKICYTWVDGDLDVIGTWLLMVYVESPTLKLHSETQPFEVANIL